MEKCIWIKDFSIYNVEYKRKILFSFLFSSYLNKTYEKIRIRKKKVDKI